MGRARATHAAHLVAHLQAARGLVFACAVLPKLRRPSPAQSQTTSLVRAVSPLEAHRARVRCDTRSGTLQQPPRQRTPSEIWWQAERRRPGVPPSLQDTRSVRVRSRPSRPPRFCGTEPTISRGQFGEPGHPKGDAATPRGPPTAETGSEKVCLCRGSTTSPQLRRATPGMMNHMSSLWRQTTPPHGPQKGRRESDSCGVQHHGLPAARGCLWRVPEERSDPKRAHYKPDRDVERIASTVAPEGHGGRQGQPQQLQILICGSL